MTHSAQLAAFDDALALSQRMYQSAEQGDWGEVVDLEQRRQALLKTAIGDAPADTLAAAVRGKIEQILAGDKRLQELVAAARQQAGGELSRMNQGHKASRAYQRNSRR